MHRIALATVFVCLAAAAPVLADPGDQLWSFFGIEDIQTMAHLPADANGDGTHDILIETYDAGATGDRGEVERAAQAGPRLAAVAEAGFGADSHRR